MQIISEDVDNDVDKMAWDFKNTSDSDFEQGLAPSYWGEYWSSLDEKTILRQSLKNLNAPDVRKYWLISFDLYRIEKQQSAHHCFHDRHLVFHLGSFWFIVTYPHHHHHYHHCDHDDHDDHDLCVTLLKPVSITMFKTVKGSASPPERYLMMMSLWLP